MERSLFSRTEDDSLLDPEQNVPVPNWVMRNAGKKAHYGINIWWKLQRCSATLKNKNIFPFHLRKSPSKVLPCELWTWYVQKSPTITPTLNTATIASPGQYFAANDNKSCSVSHGQRAPTDHKERGGLLQPCFWASDLIIHLYRNQGFHACDSGSFIFS